MRVVPAWPLLACVLAAGCGGSIADQLRALPRPPPPPPTYYPANGLGVRPDAVPESPDVPGDRGAICEAAAAPAAACRSICLPDERLDQSNCCVPLATPSSSCPYGQSVSADTASHCCWPGQVWSNGCCVGIPTECPAPRVRTPQGCGLPACEGGLTRAGDGVHCCWPGQAYSRTRNLCVGAPQCPAPLVAFGGPEFEGCVPRALNVAGWRSAPRTHDDRSATLWFAERSPEWMRFMESTCLRTGKSPCYEAVIGSLLPGNCHYESSGYSTEGGTPQNNYRDGRLTSISWDVCCHADSAR